MTVRYIILLLLKISVILASPRTPTCLNLIINQEIRRNCVNTDKHPVLLLTDNNINVTCETQPPVKGCIYIMIIHNNSHMPRRNCFNVSHCSIHEKVKRHDLEISCSWNTLKRRNVILGSVPLRIIKPITTTSVPTLNTPPVSLRSLTEKSLEWPWSQACVKYTRTMGTLPNGRNLSLSTVVMHGTEVYLENEWSWDRNETNVNTVPRLWGMAGKEIKIGCRMINGSTHKKATEISVHNITSNTEDTKRCASERFDCWYNFTLVQPVFVICLWAHKDVGLSFKFKIDITEPSTTTSASPHLTSTPTVKDKKGLSPQISKIGPYAIKYTGQQQVLLNPSWSLKRVELSMQVNISATKPTCLPFLNTSYTGWSAWLHGRTLTSPKQSRRDVTGILGTGLGALNSMDAEVLANKISSAPSNLHKLEHPLQSSLVALQTNQWLSSDILPQWERMNEKDNQLIVNALGAAQINVSLALSCIEAQLWVQSTVAAIVREGEEGTLPTEIRKVIWDNATKFEREFQSWWCLVNFTYDPTNSKAIAFVLTIRNASVYTIYPIVALGLNHHGTVLYPLEHRVWARQNGKKWQTVDVDACVVQEQQGFICESNNIKAQDICLDTEHNICHFEIHPDETPETVLISVGNGCICMRTLCDSVFVDNTTVETNNHSNICICNFTRIRGCDFNYSAPVTTYQLLQSNYISYQDLLPTPIGMNLTVVRELLQHDDLSQLLKRIRNNRQRTLITIHHDAEKIHHVLEKLKKDGELHSWDTLFGWSPTATGTLNFMLHPIVILLALTILCLSLIIILYVKVWYIMKQIPPVHCKKSPNNVINSNILY